MTRVPMRPTVARQRGIAIITVMLIVALVTTLATQLSLAQALWLRQAQNLRDLAQAESVTQGALNFSLAVLDRDKDRNSDNFGEDWATPQIAPVADGAIGGQILDAQSRFNINNLAAGAQAEMQLFARLLAYLELDAALNDAVIDWIDADANARAGGAEDDYYMNLPNGGYRAANRLLESIDELRLVKGFAGTDALAKLRPFITALPISNAKININTAPPAVVAALFNPPLTASEAAQVLTDRGNAGSGRQGRPFQSCSELKTRMPTKTLDETRCDVKTGYFEVEMVAKFGRLQRPTVALIARTAGATGNTPAKILWQRQNIVKEFQLAKN